MEDTEKIVDQSVLAEDVSSKIPYEFTDFFLVKPLDVIKVKKEVSKPVTKDKKPVKDENGIVAVDFDDVETEVVEVDSDFRKGVILKLPKSYVSSFATQPKDRPYVVELHVGDVVVFRDMSAKYFDLLKDSKLIKYYDIIAIEK